MTILKVKHGLGRKQGCAFFVFIYISFLVPDLAVAPSAFLGRLQSQRLHQPPVATFVAVLPLRLKTAAFHTECSPRPWFRVSSKKWCARSGAGKNDGNPSSDKRDSEAPEVLLLRPPTRPGAPSPTAQDLSDSMGLQEPVPSGQLQKQPSGSGQMVPRGVKEGRVNLYKMRNVKELVEALEAGGGWDAQAMSSDPEEIQFAVQVLFRMADMFNTKSKPSVALVDRARTQVEAILGALTASASLLPGAAMAKAVNAASRLSKQLYPPARTQPRAMASFFAAVSVRTKTMCSVCVGTGHGGLAAECEMDSRTLAILLNALSKVSAELCECTSAVIVRLDAMSGQDCALMLNAFSKTPHPPPSAAYQHLADTVKRLLPSALDTQAVSMVVNAMAKADMRDGELLRHLSGVVQALPKKDFSPQAVSTIANGYAKLEHRDAALFAFLEETTMLLPASAFSSQAVSMIVNSFVKAEVPSKVLFRYLAVVACQISLKHVSAQSVALILHGFERCGLKDPRLFHRLAEASKQMQFRDVQAVASVIGSFSFVGYDDTELYEHLVSSFMKLTSGGNKKSAACDGQKAGMILGAAVKHNFLSAELLEHFGQLLMGMGRSQMQPFDIASIAHALSRSELQSPALMDHLASLVKADASLAGFSPPMLAMLVAAYTRSSEWDIDLLQRLASEISRQPNHAWELPDLINLLSTNLRVKDRLGGCMLSDEDYVSGKVSSGLAAEPASANCQILNGMSSDQIGVLSEMAAMLQRCSKERIRSLSVDDFSLSLANNVYSHCARVGLMENDEAFAKHVQGILVTKLSTWTDRSLRPALAELKQTASTSSSTAVSRTVQEGAQTVAVVAASLATAGGDEEELWAMTTKIALSLPTESFNARSVSTLLNAFARRGRFDQKILDRCSYILQYHVAGDIDPSVQEMQGNYELWTVGGATIGSVFNAYAKLQVTDEPLFRKMSRLARLLRPEDFNPVEVSMVVNAVARLEYADEALFLHMREAVLSHNDTQDFGLQAIANIANAYARVKMLDSDLVEHLSALIRRYPAREVSAQHVATLANAWAKAEVKDEALWAHWSAAILGMDRSDLDLQAIANIFHAMATLHVVDIGLIRRLSNDMVQMPVSESNPQAAAIIAWSVAVLQPFISLEANMRSAGQRETCKEVVRWVLDAVVLHWARLDRHCLSQVHQLLIGCRLSNLTIPVELAESSHQAMLAAFTNSSEMISLSSNQQADVARTLSAIGYALEMEYIEPETGYSFDIWMPDENLVVEFDGPFHYCNNTRIPLGSTVMKHRHIRQMGFILVVIPFWSWDISGSDALERKQKFLKEQIRTAVSNRNPTAA